MKLLVQKMATANTKTIWNKKGLRNVGGLDFGIDELSTAISVVDEQRKNDENLKKNAKEVLTRNSDKVADQVRKVRDIGEKNPKLQKLDESILNGDANMGAL